MKINIFSTPGVESLVVNASVNLLNKVPGPLKFSYWDSIDLIYFGDQEKQKYSETQISFNKLDIIANRLRRDYDIQEDEFLVILTELRLDFTFMSNKDWFGYFNEKNIFVRTYGWEEYSKNKPQITIAHQVVENIFQSLSGYEFERFTGYHKRAIGCINDFCQNDYDIELKLRAGSICKSCLDVAVKNNVPLDILNQINKYINLFRNELSDFESIIDMIGIPEMKIDKSGNIFIGGKEIPMDPINKTFYIFSILNQGEKITSDYLKGSFNTLENLYYAVKRNAESNKAVYKLTGIIHPDFRKNSNVKELDKNEPKEKMKKYIKDKRNEIKTEIKKVVGEEIAEIYKIGSVKCNDIFSIEFCSIFPENKALNIEIDSKLHEIVI